MKVLTQSLVAVLTVSLLTACPGKQKSAKPPVRPVKPTAPAPETKKAPESKGDTSPSTELRPEFDPNSLTPSFTVPEAVVEAPASPLIPAETPSEIPAETPAPEVQAEIPAPVPSPSPSPAPAPKVEGEPAPQVKTETQRSELEEIKLYLNTLEAQLNEIKSFKGELTIGSMIGVTASFALASVYGMKAHGEFMKQADIAGAFDDAAKQAKIKANLNAISQINKSWVYDRGSIKSKYALPADTQFKEVTRLLPDGRGGYTIEMIKEVPVGNWKQIAVIRMQQPLNAPNLTTDVVLLEGPQGHSQAVMSKSVEAIREEAKRIRQTTKVEPIKVSRMTKSAPAAVAFGAATAIFTALGTAVNSDTVLSPGNERQVRLLLKQSREKLAKLQAIADSAAQDPSYEH